MRFSACLALASLTAAVELQFGYIQGYKGIPPTFRRAFRDYMENVKTALRALDEDSDGWLKTDDVYGNRPSDCRNGSGADIFGLLLNYGYEDEFPLEDYTEELQRRYETKFKEGWKPQYAAGYLENELCTNFGDVSPECGWYGGCTSPY